MSNHARADGSSKATRVAGAVLGKDVIPPHAVEFGKELQNSIHLVTSARIDPNRRRDNFEESVKRLGLTQQQLEVNFRALRRLHLTMYAMALVLALAALYCGLVSMFAPMFGLICGGLFAVVQGYVYGFRAWQIAHRELISLSEALRRSETYLML